MGGEYFLALAPNRRAVFVHNWGLKPTDLYVNFDGFLDKEWHHVAFTYDGTTRKIYIDGELKNSDTPSGSIKPNAQGVSIGYWYANTGFNGLIDEVRISKEIRKFTPYVVLMPDSYLRNFNYLLKRWDLACLMDFYSGNGYSLLRD